MTAFVYTVFPPLVPLLGGAGELAVILEHKADYAVP
jgi:hypothetical protein